MNPVRAAGALAKAAKKGLGERAAEAALKTKKTARDEAIIAARDASKRGFLEPSKERGRMYHGTPKDVSELSNLERGFVSLTKDPDFASEYAGGMKEVEEGLSPNVMPVYAQVRNPFDYENPEHIDMVLRAYRKPEGVDIGTVRDNLELGNWNFLEDKRIQEAIKGLGFDSFYMKEQGLKNLGVFDPKQIKSATGMSGRYDIEDPDVTKAAGGSVDKKLKAWHENRMADGGAVDMTVGTLSKSDDDLSLLERYLAFRERRMQELAAKNPLDIRRLPGKIKHPGLLDMALGGLGGVIGDEIAHSYRLPKNVEDFYKKFYPQEEKFDPFEEELRFEEINKKAEGGPIEVRKKAGGAVSNDIYADLGDPSTVMTFGSLAMANGGEVKMSNGGVSTEGFIESGLPPDVPQSDEILVGRGVRRKRPKVSEILETPTYATKSALEAMGSAALGAGQATAGLVGDIESLAQGAGAAIMPPAGEGRLDAFLRGMGEETLFPTTEDVKKFTDPYISAPMEQFETLGQFTGIPIVVSPKVRGAIKKGIEAITPEGRPLPVGASTEAVGTPIEQILKPGEAKAPANQLGLYSGLEKAALNLERKQGSGDAFLNDLKKLATKYGVSKEEFEYSGLDDFLKGKKSVTRDDIQDFTQSNRYEMSEVEYKEGKGSQAQLYFRGEAVDDTDHINIVAGDMKADFDDYFGVERRAQIIDDIESNYTPEELADPGIRADVDRLIDQKINEVVERAAHDQYWENPYYRYENELGYEITGSNDAGYTVRDTQGRAVGDYYPDMESATGAANQHAMDLGLVSEGQTQYQDYQLPLGENYREILLQTQTKPVPNLTKAQRARFQELNEKLDKPTESVAQLQSRVGPLTKDELAELNGLREQIKKLHRREEFTGGHWSEPDVIAHMRVQDRVLTNGKPMLYVDEMQSDWHQEGLKYGYKDKANEERYNEVYRDYLDKKNAVDKITNEISNRRRGMLGTADSDSDPELQKLREELAQKRAELEPVRKEYEKLTNAVPNAPFKENWHELGIKRMLNYAAQNGYDRIGFSSASPQIKRWGTQEIAWERAPKIENNFESYKAYVKERYPARDESIVSSWADKDDQVYQAFIRDTERPAGWKVAATEQRGGMAGRVDLEAEARARGLLKEQPKKIIRSQDELRRIIDDTTRGMSEEQIDRLTKKTWERMQKFDTGISAPREEGMRAFYDQKMKNTLQKYAERIGAKFYESSTKVGRGVRSEGGYTELTEPVYVIEFTDKAKDSAIKGQSYKKGGLVKDERLKAWHKEQKMAAGGLAKGAKAIAEGAKKIGKIDEAAANVSKRLAADAEKNKSKPIATDKVVASTVNKAAERIAKQNPKLSEEEVAKKAEREALAKLKWEREEKPAIEARYGELEKSTFDDPRSKRMRNVPGVVEERIAKAEEFLAQPTEAWQPPRQELQAFDRSLIRDALEGFPGIEQTRFPRAQATRADLGYLEEIYGDPRNRSLIEKQIKRGLPLGGETFYASLYPVKVAALERGIPESKFNQWVYENAPASARNSILNEMAVGQFLRDMNARGLPLDEKTVTEEMAKFKQQYGTGLPLMPVHREGVRSVIEGGQDLRELVKADIPTNYKIPTYGTQKAGDFGKSMVLDVHESAGQTMGSRYHPYFTEQGGFAPLEYGPAEAQMLGIAESLGIPGGMAQAGRWFGGGELTGLKSPRGDALDLLEKQTAYTLQGLGIKPTPRTIRNYILDMIETGEGVLMPYFKSEPLPDVRTKKEGGLAKKRMARGGLAAVRT